MQIYVISPTTSIKLNSFLDNCVKNDTSFLGQSKRLSLQKKPIKVSWNYYTQLIHSNYSRDKGYLIIKRQSNWVRYFRDCRYWNCACISFIPFQSCPASSDCTYETLPGIAFVSFYYNLQSFRIIGPNLNAQSGWVNEFSKT